ncbi:MAG: phosphohydrolase [Sulfurimonas sp. RIFCSPHIGHO2_12_FULL_36_9]|uniref:HD domain-containing protein n=1 Tax=Sulfurimonas sp. RIFCSPLOWO2_12_36_12 TaxID=1802253 RepID=UPI0008B17126|nr:HD domain-containing protein [Sulfurimonas sp. RIFCSPLOWO2_12_36_12]OHD98174.1 MAG: phosphohydrolase [Sulfurimonas sp. RIFCSPHIGHO2_12_FULL_36_9]OHD99956.1 MAG: phosphohydrolase [Sulfurimonas sp. RIFCSPLOWO2_02_FULL_36_28]OHE00353.1 MAG: phosphohydrolase [Sulfurimonas sp. RIFCSPLOWO2_12_36_12]OHE06998.1 MAG: phosphohydrolase [Sulfurimonas sp. RIFCSPLOWO2_12_FULL_36_74]
MNQINNSIFSRPFLESLFFIQNKWHQHGVLVHTLRVTYYALKAGEFKFFGAALLHDIGKPFSAYKKDEEDIEFGEYSFTDHEERSYEIIKNWSFVSNYTKEIVRYHYLIRDLVKSKKEDLLRYESKKKIWDTLTPEIKNDLAKFLLFDDLGKGKQRRQS